MYYLGKITVLILNDISILGTRQTEACEPAWSFLAVVHFKSFLGFIGIFTELFVASLNEIVDICAAEPDKIAVFLQVIGRVIETIGGHFEVHVVVFIESRVPDTASFAEAAQRFKEPNAFVWLTFEFGNQFLDEYVTLQWLR